MLLVGIHLFIYVKQEVWELSIVWEPSVVSRALNESQVASGFACVSNKDTVFGAMDFTRRVETLWWVDELPKLVLVRGCEHGVGGLCGPSWLPAPCQSSEVSIIWGFTFLFQNRLDLQWDCMLHVQETLNSLQTFKVRGGGKKSLYVNNFPRCRVFSYPPKLKIYLGQNLCP